MTQSNTTPAHNGFDDEEEVTFDHSPASNHPPSASAAPSNKPLFKFTSAPRPVGIRSGYVKEIKHIQSKKDSKWFIVVSVQVSDPEFPVSDGNRPVDLMIGEDEEGKASRVAKVLGLTLEDLATPDAARKGEGVHVRVFVTVYNDRPQIPRFTPSWTKRTPETNGFFDHVENTLKLDKDAYYNLAKDYCGLLPDQ